MFMFPSLIRRLEQDLPGLLSSRLERGQQQQLLYEQWQHDQQQRVQQQQRSDCQRRNAEQSTVEAKCSRREGALLLALSLEKERAVTPCFFLPSFLHSGLTCGMYCTFVNKGPLLSVHRAVSEASKGKN